MLRLSLLGTTTTHIHAFLDSLTIALFDPVVIEILDPVVIKILNLWSAHNVS